MGSIGLQLAHSSNRRNHSIAIRGSGILRGEPLSKRRVLHLFEELLSDHALADLVEGIREKVSVRSEPQLALTREIDETVAKLLDIGVHVERKLGDEGGPEVIRSKNQFVLGVIRFDYGTEQPLRTRVTCTLAISRRTLNNYGLLSVVPRLEAPVLVVLVDFGERFYERFIPHHYVL